MAFRLRYANNLQANNLQANNLQANNLKQNNLGLSATLREQPLTK
ncbi:hypothetical protein [Moorena sp. SIO4A1]|nr:hypothetical protein [Moorena sp. SIO4A1]